MMFHFSGIAYFVLPLTLHWSIPWLLITYRSWRLYTLILALPLGIGALLLLCVFESPKFLANKGETKEALRLLRRIYVINGGDEDKFPVLYCLLFAKNNYRKVEEGT